MCILFLSICACPEPGAFRLVLASNRDEYYRRPTEKAHHWTDAPNVIGGRDMEPGREGGTWLAMDTSGYGRIAVLLNVMGGPADPKAKGRGFLVSDWVHSNDTAKDYIERVAEHGQEFNGFHLVAVDLSPSSIAQGVWHYSNCSEVDGVGTQVTQIREGQLSLGNSLKSRPFQKVTAGSERFRKIVQCLGRRETTDQLVQEIIKVLAWNHEHVPDEELDARGGRANMPPETRRLCSSIFQRHPSYGTRTHTIILVDSEWRCDFHEWTLEAPVNPNSSKWIHTHRQYSLGQSN